MLYTSFEAFFIKIVHNSLASYAILVFSKDGSGVSVDLILTLRRAKYDPIVCLPPFCKSIYVANVAQPC